VLKARHNIAQGVSLSSQIKQAQFGMIFLFKNHDKLVRRQGGLPTINKPYFEKLNRKWHPQKG